MARDAFATSNNSKFKPYNSFKVSCVGLRFNSIGGNMDLKAERAARNLKMKPCEIK